MRESPAPRRPSMTFIKFFSGARIYSIPAVIVVALLLIAFIGGIGVGGSNHFGQLPVVRRILDPSYLPGDFGIEIRQYHHRVFAYLIAGLSAIFGEDRALIILNCAAMILLAASLWRLCRALNLPLIAYLAAGLFLATGFIWAGKGLELNTFVGDPDIMPPAFAHSFVLLAVVATIRKRYRLTAFLCGLAALFHLQIGLICALAVAPFYLVRIRRFSPVELFQVAGLFVLAAAPSLFDLYRMLRQGLLRAPSTEYSLAYYIDFRHPHHFELISGLAAVWITVHIFNQGFAYFWLRRESRPESGSVGTLLGISLTLSALSALHFVDYYLIRDGRLATMQFIRLSPLISVLGTLAILVVINAWVKERWGETSIRHLAAANLGLILIGSLWGGYVATRPDAAFSLSITRAAERKTIWIEMCRWIHHNGPAGETYLTPPGNNGFTSLAERSTVADFKNNPDGALHMAEWFARLRDLSGGELPAGRGFENRPLLNQAFAKLSSAQLVELGRKYRARYAILSRDSKADFPVLYQNKTYRLVRLLQ